MRKINTRRFGEIEIEEKTIAHFKDGIPAFEDEHEFAILPYPYEENTPYMFLQSANTPELAFLVTNPFAFFPDYTFELDDASMAALDVKGLEDVAICTLISIPLTGVKDMTTNLLAPVVINRHTMEAKQVVLEKSPYNTKHRLFPQAEADKKGAE